MWVRGYKKVLPAAYKGVGPAHLSRVKSETYGNEVSRVGDGVNQYFKGTRVPQGAIIARLSRK